MQAEGLQANQPAGFGELVERIAPPDPPKEWEGLKNLVAVDGSLLPGLPRMTWALWQDQRHRAAKMHVQFEVRNDRSKRQVVCPSTISSMAGSIHRDYEQRRGS